MERSEKQNCCQLVGIRLCFKNTYVLPTTKYFLSGDGRRFSRILALLVNIRQSLVVISGELGYSTELFGKEILKSKIKKKRG